MSACRVRIHCEGMADKHDVITLCGEGSVCFVRDMQFGQCSAEFKAEPVFGDGDLGDPGLHKAYTGILVIADILERAASSDPEKVLTATRQTNFKNHPVVSGPIKFDEKGDNMDAVTALVQLQPAKEIHDRPKIALPKEFAQTDEIVFPAPQLWKR